MSPSRLHANKELSMQITRTSMISGKRRVKEVDVTDEQLDTYYKKGALLQDAFPHLSASDREFIKTGITDDEWDEALSDD